MEAGEGPHLTECISVVAESRQSMITAERDGTKQATATTNSQTRHCRGSNMARRL